jgi:hypothetical protein
LQPASYRLTPSLPDNGGSTSVFVVATFYGVTIVTDSRADAPPPVLTADLGVTATFSR